jgi:hypothetical protein
MDSNFCHKAHASAVPLVDIGSPVYHVGRGTLHAQVGAYRKQPGEAPWGNVRWNCDMIYENRDDWGLGLAPERSLDVRTTLLEFDWGAVGPMVELTRVVPPNGIERTS